MFDIDINMCVNLFLLINIFGGFLGVFYSLFYMVFGRDDVQANLSSRCLGCLVFLALVSSSGSFLCLWASLNGSRATGLDFWEIF